MELIEYQNKCKRTMNSAPDLTNACLGLTGEAGECADLLKKYLFQGHELDKNKLLNEIGDVMWYCALACTALDCTLEDAAWANIKKLEARYPHGFEVSKSVSRTI